MRMVEGLTVWAIITTERPVSFRPPRYGLCGGLRTPIGGTPKDCADNRTARLSNNPGPPHAMASYMSQDLFNMLAVTAIQIHVATGDPLDQACGQLCAHYLDSFPEDTDLEREVRNTSAQLMEVMRSQFEENQMYLGMRQLQFCIYSYNLDGKKKRRPLFSGTWFTRSKLRDPDRAKNCLMNIMVYHLGTMNGMFPLAPGGWSLSKRSAFRRLMVHLRLFDA